MLELITSIFSAIVSVIVAVFPDSPFANLTWLHDISRGLGWLNWICPIGDMLGIMTVWLAAIVVVYGGRFITGKISAFINGFVGRS